MKKVFRNSVILLVSVVTALVLSRVMSTKSLDTKPFDHIKRPLTIAHRGGMVLWPENTLYAFERAVEMGVDVLEFDVRPTAEGNVVVIHDATVDRTSNGSGRVNQMTLAELKKLDFAYHFIPAGENRPTLRGWNHHRSA